MGYYENGYSVQRRTLFSPKFVDFGASSTRLLSIQVFVVTRSMTYTADTTAIATMLMASLIKFPVIRISLALKVSAIAF